MSRSPSAALVIAARDGVEIDGARFNGARAAALARFGNPGKRADGAAEAWAAYYEHRFDGIVGSGKRADADGAHFARDLDFIRKTVIEEKYAIPSALTLFPIDTSVPVGARSHWVRRGHEQGEAVIYRAGVQIPRATVSSDEEEFPVRYVVDAFDTTMFETNSSDFAGSNVLGRKARAARNLIVQKINRLAWFGSSDHGLYGIMNYPWLNKAVSDVSYSGSAAADTVIADLNKWADSPANNSNNVLSPNRCATSPRVRNMIMSKPRSATTDTTIGKFFTSNNNPGITQIDAAWELQGTGPGGTDGILFWRDDVESVGIVMVGGMGMLPVQREDFTDKINMYQGFGGVVMPDSGNNLLVFVTPPS